MTADTLTFLLRLLDAQQISVGTPDFETVTATVIRARRELVEALDTETNE